MAGKDLVKRLKEQGWTLDRINGSHHIMIKGDREVSVPVHAGRDIPTGTLHRLLKLTGLKA